MPNALVQRANWSPRLRVWGEGLDVDERKWKSLDDERAGDRDRVDPLPSCVQNLQGADLVLLPQNCKTLPHPLALFERKLRSQSDLVAGHLLLLVGVSVFWGFHLITHSVCAPIPMVRSSMTPV